MQPRIGGLRDDFRLAGVCHAFDQRRPGAAVHQGVHRPHGLHPGELPFVGKPQRAGQKRARPRAFQMPADVLPLQDQRGAHGLDTFRRELQGERPMHETRLRCGLAMGDDLVDAGVERSIHQLPGIPKVAQRFGFICLIARHAYTMPAPRRASMTALAMSARFIV